MSADTGSNTAKVVGGVSLKIKDDPVKQPDLPFWQSPAFFVTCMLVIPIYFVTFVVLWPWAVATGQPPAFSPEMKSVVITAACITTLVAITGFWLAGSHGSRPNPDPDDKSKTPPTPGASK